MELTYKLIKVLAHDLKGPAGNVKMFSEILQDMIDNLEVGKPVGADEKESLQAMCDNVNSISAKYLNQIQNWVDTYALAAGEYELHKNAVDINEMLDEMIEGQQRFIQKKQIELVNMSSHHVMQAEKDLLFRSFDVLGAVLVMFSPRNATHYIQYSGKELLIGTYPAAEKELLIDYLIHPSDVFDEKYYNQSVIKSSGFGLVFAHFALSAHGLEPELKELESGDFMIKITGF